MDSVTFKESWQEQHKGRSADNIRAGPHLHTLQVTGGDQLAAIRPALLITGQRGDDEWDHTVTLQSWRGDTKDLRLQESVPCSQRRHVAGSPLSQRDQPLHSHPINRSLLQNAQEVPSKALWCSVPARSQCHTAVAVTGIRQQHLELPVAFG